jgi:hypothetical protein
MSVEVSVHSLQRDRDPPIVRVAPCGTVYRDDDVQSDRVCGPSPRCPDAILSVSAQAGHQKAEG